MILFVMNAGDIISEELSYDLFNESIHTFFESESKICAFRSKNFYSDIHYYAAKKIKANKDFSKWITNNTPVHQSIILNLENIAPLLNKI